MSIPTGKVLLSVLADGCTSSLSNAPFDRHISMFDIAVQ